MATSSLSAGQPYIQFLSPDAVLEIPVSKDVIQNVLIPFYANVYGVDASYMSKIVNCESGFNSNIIGDKGTSYGLVQIHNPGQTNHKDISIPEAMNASFSLNYLASSLKNHSDHWSCQTILAANST